MPDLHVGDRGQEACPEVLGFQAQGVREVGNRLAPISPLISLVPEQEMIDRFFRLERVGLPLLRLRIRLAAELAQVIGPALVISSGRRPQGDGLRQKLLERFAELAVAVLGLERLRHRLGQDQKKRVTTSDDLFLLIVRVVPVQDQRGGRAGTDAENVEGLAGRGTSPLLVEARIEAAQARLQEKRLIPFLAEVLIGALGDQARFEIGRPLVDSLKQFLGLSLKSLKFRFRPDSVQCLHDLDLGILQFSLCQSLPAHGHRILHHAAAGLYRAVVFQFLCGQLGALPLIFGPDEGSEQEAHDRQETDAGERRSPGSPSRPFDAPLPNTDRPGPNRFARQEPRQVVGQRAGAAVAPLRLLVQALQADRLQVARHRGLQPRITWVMVSTGVSVLNGGRPVSRS